ncbi:MULTISPECIES: hypothetical protein [Streptomyces]|uniref:Uncharacterized protein n=1 Tax=Streptomyces yunnanensis TaxID=156453 RepID=A0A9X8N5J3_9ACTN|nr:hypothetical protein [Streptomyces yunnanensis]SHN07657.1 hypothetical protein SAMN05216268_11932 [Streptomyces yunnanensis]
MSVLPTIFEPAFRAAAILSAVTAFSYCAAVVTVAASSVLFRTPQRRRDARATLSILMRRNGRR